jgi:hypothetical protein
VSDGLERRDTATQLHLHFLRLEQNAETFQHVSTISERASCVLGQLQIWRELNPVRVIWIIRFITFIRVIRILALGY